tara:strand:+ start:1978 stop:4398 length:2421 start_codon:yes stop_codon:yes gene_type:complete
MKGKVTIFQNVHSTSVPHYLGIDKILDRVRNGASKESILAIRKLKDKSDRNDLKKNLPAVCFSGEFPKRRDNAIMVHSGIICLDFDNFSTVARRKAIRESMEADSYVMSVFTSPSGNGLKVLIKIPPIIENHVKYFNALQDYWKLEEFDTACKNISRVCYESYDPNIYVNYESEEWTEMVEEVYKEYKKTPLNTTIAVTEESEIISRLLVWWNREYGLVEGKKNDNLYILAASMNKFGVSKIGCQYSLRDFDQGKERIRTEILQLISSAYNVTAEFNTKVFEDGDKMHSLERKLKRGESKQAIEEQIIEEYSVDKKEAKAIVQKIDKSAQEDLQVFWKKSSKGVVSIEHDRFTEFLQDNGFFKFYPEGSKNFIFVRRISNRVKNTTEQTIKDFVLGYIRSRVEDRSVWNFFADKVRFFKEDFLSMVEAIEIQFMEDTIDESYLFFKNVAICVTKDSVETIEYEKLPGWIWEDQMIDRDFKDCDGDKCEFRQFIHNISENETKRVQSVESTIGFLIHGYKPPSNCPAVILNDEIISENPEGGTGKGIFTQAIGHLRKASIIDGKMFSFDKSFPYQTVQQDTQILAYDDVPKNWKFENIFSLITEGMTLEKKNKDAIKIKFSDSPKIIVTTNYALRGSGNSFDRRKWELEFKQFYSKDFTPREEFGHDLFTDWSDGEWCIFDNYMVGCLQMYLEKGFIKSPFKNLNARKLIAATNHDFYEWMNDPHNEYRLSNVKYLAYSAFNSFVEEYSDYAPRSKRALSKGFFIQWLMAWGEYHHGGESERGKGSNGVWIEFNKKEVKNNQIKTGL